MSSRITLAYLSDRLDRESMGPDLGRAFRSAIALLIPLLLSLHGPLPFGLEAPMVGIGAWTLAGVDVHGPYPLRFAFLLVMSAVMVGATALGTLTSGHVALAVMGAGVIAVNAGLWRHLTAEYGPSLAVPTGLVFLIALNSTTNANHTAGVAAGAGLAMLLQVMMWPIHPQHPLRQSIAHVWSEVAKLFDAFATGAPESEKTRDRVAAIEGQIRKALDDARATLTSVRHSKSLVNALETLRVVAGRIATRGSAAEIIITASGDPSKSRDLQIPFRSLAESIAALSRTIALTVVSREPAHLAVARVRLARAIAGVRSLRDACAAKSDQPEAAGLADIARLLGLELDRVAATMESVTARGQARSVFPTEFFDLRTWRLQPLAAALNLRARIDPILWRFTARLGMLLMLGVFAMRLIPTSHAYWLPYTILVVSQPDYGATRRRAIERAGGTLIGVIVAAMVIRIGHAPLYKLAVISICGFIYGYQRRQRYAVAVIFLTITVIMLIDVRSGATWRDPLERLAGTAAGGAIALLAAIWFWPDWEQRRHPPIVAAALSANRECLQAVVARLHEGGAYDAKEIAAKRKAESANAAAFASLGRLFSDPSHRRGKLERAAAVVNSNQRLTRLLSVLLLHATPDSPPMEFAALDQFAERGSTALKSIAHAINALAGGQPIPPAPTFSLEPAVSEIGNPALGFELAKAAAELKTMLNGAFASEPAVS